MRECGVVTAGVVIRAFDPCHDHVGYESGAYWTDGCFFNKCPNGYVYYLANWNCTKGHRSTRTWAPGWPQCPHGYPYSGTDTKEAHCCNDSGWNDLGYRAPCEKQFQESMYEKYRGDITPPLYFFSPS